MQTLATVLSTLIALPLLADVPQAPDTVRASATQPVEAAATPEELAQLADELREMMRLDQLYRTPVSWGTTDPEELARLEALDDEAHLEEAKRRWRLGIELPKAQRDELMAKQSVLDKQNFERLVELIERFGYPDPERLGLEAPSPVPILIHAENAWYDSVAERLRAEALAHRMPGKEFAALTDRKAQHAGKRQLYGTCRRFDPATNQVLPPEIESIERTNAARAAIGLPPLTEYLIVE